MPVEAGRVTKRKRIVLGDSYVDIPVITQISFIDPNDRYQEIQFTIDNSAQGTRRVHVVTLHSADDDADHLQVERIDTWPVFDAADRGQETQNSLDNVTGEDAQPLPHFSTHVKTHCVTYQSGDDTSTTIITELIDEFAVFDVNDRGQDTHYVLTGNPPPGKYTMDPSDPDISDSGNGIDPPWRTDPFQNIVGFTTDSGPPPPAWWTLQHGGEHRVTVNWNPSFSVPGCDFFDQPSSSYLGNYGRPLSYHICGWPIADPVPVPPPAEFDWSLIAYSAGTLYKKRSEFEHAFATKNYPPESTFITWRTGPPFGASSPGADTADSGALAPEVNEIFNGYEVYRTEPGFHWTPIFRVFLVEDADWETWMGGIHDFVDRPEQPTS